MLVFITVFVRLEVALIHFGVVVRILWSLSTEAFELNALYKLLFHFIFVFVDSVESH